ncbi:MAG TPA: nuclear transport factor 2 family protein [Terriglobales bacterium]|jgi:Domain of unknown function (DUF4440)|nr:nuclear transport factor 2 family protein [Terriglobales bacterium]
MKRCAFAVLFLTMLLPSHAQEKGLERDVNPAAVAEVRALELKLSDLIVQGNWNEYEKILASGYVRTTADGQSENKDQSLATLRSGEPKIVAMIPEEMEVSVYGDTAILTGNLTITARKDNKIRERHSRLTDVFIRRGGAWYLSATQMTFVSGK